MVNKNAVIYIRVSNKEQDEERQVIDAEYYVKDNGINLKKTFNLVGIGIKVWVISQLSKESKSIVIISLTSLSSFTKRGEWFKRTKKGYTLKYGLYETITWDK